MQNLAWASGKAMRINPDGTIPAGNPFADGPGGNLDEIWAYGLRNPFRSRWDLPSGRWFIGDVGGNDQDTAYEEVNLGQAGANYGWPVCEGDCGDPAYQAPLHSYPHAGSGASITGGVVYRATQFPSQYHGAYFYADYVRRWIRYLTFDENGNVTGDFEFDPDAGVLVALDVGPGGALYYIHYWGRLDRIVHENANLVPVITQAEADVTSGPAPLSVQFTGAATDDGPGPLDCRWVFGDGNESDGLSEVKTAALLPDKVDLTSDTVPTGLTLLLDGIPRATPFTYDTLIGFHHELEAPPTQCVT